MDKVDGVMKIDRLGVYQHRKGCSGVHIFNIKNGVALGYDPDINAINEYNLDGEFQHWKKLKSLNLTKWLRPLDCNLPKQSEENE